MSLKAKLAKKQLKTIEAYLLDHPELQEEIVEVMQEQPLARYKNKQSFKENFSSNSFFRTYLISWIKRHHPEILKRVKSKEIEKIEEELAQLKR